MDDDTYAWKNPRACSAPIPCKRTATVGYTTCARCRLHKLVQAHPEVLRDLSPAARGGLVELSEKDAMLVERPFRDTLNAQDAALNALARVLGMPTVVRPAGADVVCTFGGEEAPRA